MPGRRFGPRRRRRQPPRCDFGNTRPMPPAPLAPQMFCKSPLFVRRVQVPELREVRPDTAHMAAYTQLPEALAVIFEGPSDDEDFLGFRVSSPMGFSEDSMNSEDSGKADLRFRSKYITDELLHIFIDSDSDEEFEGFSTSGSSRVKTSTYSEENSDEDIGFYSDGECPDPPKRRSSGLCVAFRFPMKKTPGSLKRRRSSASQIRPMALKHGPFLKSAVRHLEDTAITSEEEARSKAQSQVLSKRARNIQENKAMLAKLFAEMPSIAALEPTTPTQKKKVSPKKRVSEGLSERRNPTRSARPPEHFGREEPLASLTKAKPTSSFQDVDVHKLMEVDDELRVEMQSDRKRRSRKCHWVRPVDDISREELDNVADRPRDKILDKENGSTCHQCRQKTLDTKTVCRSSFCHGVKGQFCGPCLRNRYGEDVRTALLDPTWECPICRGVCNCSLCRKRDGRCATGSLTRLAKHYGHDSVREYLDSLKEQLS
ncbi:cell division cycle-associated 7-like protein [Denticeps clupeoides]|uniref:Zinc-finger domain-containing protein n=1 Tax=Denticeps clupeoides TaxID=299321 RepID=A0AAY4D9Z6_9TELE|nr:cell division cycle-associated 7-like protein [Denticeps clupeoides]